MLTRLLGIPFLYAAASSAVGFSIYFSIGVVADRGLGLTPVIFLAAGLMFALTSLSYVEGSAMLASAGVLLVRETGVQRADQLHRRLGDPDRLPDRDRRRGDHALALPDADLR